MDHTGIEGTGMAETRQGPHDGISGWQAKLVALWTMVADHVSLIGIGASATGVMGATYLALRIAGRVSYPLFALSLVEGFRHTHSKAEHVGLLALFAAISEFPFDAAVTSACGLAWWSMQSVMLTLTLGGIAICASDWLRARLAGWKGWAGAVAVSAACAAASGLLGADYGACGVASVMAAYAVRATAGDGATGRGCEALAACLPLLALGPIELASVLAVPVWMAFDGTRGGHGTQAEKMLFYWFYPAHLALLALIAGTF